MTPIRTRAEHCGRHPSAAKSALAGPDLGPARGTDRREALSASLHALSERLTATTNYLAAAHRLCEVGSVTPAVRPCHTEILEKALGQIDQANEELRQLRKRLTVGTMTAGPVYRVCFLNEFARFNSVVKACQRAIIIRHARSQERAIEAAKKRFARLERIRDWRDHAKIIEVSMIEDESLG